MLGKQVVELLPAVDVGDGDELSAVAAFPAVAFPAGQPFHAAFGDVRAVCDNFDAGSAGELPQAFDDSLEFHLVVGGWRFAAAEFFFAARGGVAKDTAPAAGARVSTAGTVGEELHEGKADGITSHWRTSPRGWAGVKAAGDREE